MRASRLAHHVILLSVNLGLGAPALLAVTPDPFALRPEFLSQAVFSCGDAVVNGNGTVDSAGAAGTTAATGQGHLVSNGTVTVNGGAAVRGDVLAGPGMQVVRNGNPTISGRVGNLSSAMPCSPVDLAKLSPILGSSNDNAKVPKTSKGHDPLHGSSRTDFTLDANETLVLPAGTYFFTSLIVNGGAQLSVAGPVRILCTGQVVLNGNASVNPAGSPFSLRIWSSGSEVTTNGGSVLKAFVYASQGGASVTINGGGRVWGGLYGGRVTVNGGSTVTRVVDDAGLPSVAVNDGGKPLRDGSILARTVAPVISVAGGVPPLAIQVTLDGIAFQSGTNVSAEGTHRLDVAVKDAADSPASKQVSFTIDKTAPRIVILAPADGSVVAASPVDVYGTSGDAVSVSVNGRPASVSSGSFVLKGVSLTEGPNTLTAIGFDAAGNSGSAATRATLDTGAPVVVLTAPADGLVTATSTVAVTGTVSDANLVSVAVNGVAAVVTAGAFSASVALAEGTNLISVEARDAAGHVTIRTTKVDRDSAPPAIRVEEQGKNLADGSVWARSVTPSILVTDAHSPAATTLLDGLPFVPGTTVRTEGSHVLAIAARDAAGNQTSLTVRFTIDTTAPVVTIASPAAGAFIGALPARVEGSSGDAVAVAVNGLPATVSGGRYVVEAFPFPEGAVTLTAVATDAAGNAASISSTCTVDTRAPVVSIALPAPGAILGPGPILVSGVASDANLSNVTVDGVSVPFGRDGAFQSGPLQRADGPTTIAVVATDQSGKSATASVSVIVDTHPPVIAIANGATGAPISDGAVFRVPVTVAVTVTDATTQAGTMRAVLVDGAPYDGSPISGEGTHRIDVTARDGAGNAATASVSFALDTVAPVFSDLSPADGTATRTSAIVVSGKVSADTVDATVNGSAATLASSVFSFDGPALVEGTNSIALRAVDRAGNVGTATLRVILDTSPPQVSIGSPTLGQLLGSLTTGVTGTVSDPNLESVLVDGGPATVTGSSFRRDDVPLVEGKNVVTATARDRAGNSTSASVTVTVDTRPPVVVMTAPTPGTVLGATPVTVTGTADDPNLATVSVNGVAAAIDGGGRFTASVPVSEGTNLLVATGRDSLGHESSTSVSVILDSSAPVVTITSPRDGARTRSTEIAVSGTVDSAANLTGVTVNGAPAVLSGTGFTATVGLLEGPNAITARAKRLSGKEGTAGISVTRDTVAPRLVSSTPADGQSGVALSPEVRLAFSEGLDAATIVPPAVELKEGATVVPVSLSVLDAVVTLIPIEPLHDSRTYVLSLSPAVQDLAGNSLPATTVRFSTVDQAPPGAAVLDPGPSSLCAATIPLKGRAEPGATVFVSGGASAAQSVAGADGRFSVDVPLEPEARQTLAVTVRDASGNLSPAVSVTVATDCRAPQVLDVTRSPGGVTVRLDEALLSSSVRAGDTVRLDSGAGGPIAASPSLSSDGTVLSVAVTGIDLTAVGFTLSLSSGITDVAGNPLPPFIRSFAPALVSTVVIGEVYDDSIGRPLPGATATLIVSGGQPVPGPRPVATTSSSGLFSLPLAAGDGLVGVSATGFLPVYRRESVQAGTAGEVLSATLFDFRLTPLAPPAEALPTANGVRYRLERPSSLASATVEAPTGSLPAGAAVRITVRRAQGLPVLAPLGWSVAAAANLRISDEAGAAIVPAGSLALTLPDFYGATPSSALVAAHLDPVSLQWIHDGPALLRGSDILVPTTAAGDLAVFVPDPAPAGPPTPALGAPLQDVSLPDLDPLQSATVVADPVDVVPSQTVEVSLSVDASGPIPSGYPVQVIVTEDLTLLDGSHVSAPAFLADLVLGRRGDGSVGLSIPVRASEAANRLALSVGYERFAVRTFPFEVRRGVVVGASGGTVTGLGGWSLTLPAGALATPASVTLTPMEAADLPEPVPAGFDLVGALHIGTGGAPLALPASLAAGSAAVPTAGQDVILVRYEEVAGLVVLRPVARASWEAAARTVRTVPIDRSRFPWPGVTGEGTYAFLSAHDPLAFAAGHVLDVDGSRLASVRVDAAEWPLVALTEKDGTFATAIRALATTLSSVSPVTANGGSLTVTPSNQGQELTGLDLRLEITAPFVASVTPAAGSTILVSSQFTVEFSEPVDPQSVTADSFLLAARLPGSSTQAVVVPGRTDLAPGGRSVSFVPSGALSGNATLVLHVGRTIRDLTGYGLVDRATRSAADLDVTFATEDLTPPDAKPWLVTISPPSGDPSDPVVTVSGLAGAVCGGCRVTAFNDTTLATASTDAMSDGSFMVALRAKATDVVRVEVSKPNGTKQTLPTVPFTGDHGRTAIVGPGGGIWQTPEGYRIDVPGGAFSSAQTVVTTRAAQADLERLVPAPRDVTFLDSFQVEFQSPASAGFDLSFPAPPTGTPTDQFLLVQVVEVFGERRLMVVDLLGRKNDRLVTDRKGENLQALARSGWAALVDVHPGRGSEGRAHLSVVPRAGVHPVTEAIGAQTDRPSSFWDGIFKRGLYALYGAAVPMTFVAGPASGVSLVASSSTSSFVFSTDDVLTRETFRLVVAAGRAFQLSLRDASTGYTLFEGTLPPGTDTSRVTLVNPPLAVDVSPPGVSAADPAIVHRFQAPPSGASVAVTALVNATTRAEPNGKDTTVSLSGRSGATPKKAALRLVNFSRSAGAGNATSNASDGGFSGLSVAASPGDRIGLVVENTAAPYTGPVTIRFDKPMAAGNPWPTLVRVEKLTAEDPVPVAGTVVPVPVPGDSSVVREVQFVPREAFARGETFNVRVGKAATDATTARTAMANDFVATFSSKKPASTADQTTGFVRKVLHRGGLVFETGEDNQIHVFDASTMGTGAFQRECQVVALPGVGRDLAFDRFGRLVTVGGGTGSLGFLKLYDVNAGVGCRPGLLVPGGSAVVSNEVGASLLDYPPDGMPRRISLIQSAVTIAWGAGTDESKNPELKDLDLLPAGRDQSYRSALTVTSKAGREIVPAFPGQRFRRALLTNLTTGESVRSVLDVESGKASLLLALKAVTPGDRLQLEISTVSYALVEVLGYGLALVDLEATYAQGDDAPPDLTRPGIDARLVAVYDGGGAPGPRVGLGPASCDAAQRLSSDRTWCELYVAPPRDLSGLAAITDLLTLSDAVAHPVANADGTVSIFGTLSHFGLVSFNLDLLGQGRLRSLSPTQLVPLRKADPLIAEGHKIGIAGVLPLLPRSPGNGARAISLAVAPSYRRPPRPFYCTDSVWGAGDARSDRDLAFVAAGPNGVFVVDVTEPRAARRIGALATAGGALTVAVDEARKLLYVGDAGAGVRVYDVSDPCGEPTSLPSGDDPRLVATFQFGPGGASAGTSDTPVEVDPETGFALASANGTAGTSGRLAAYQLGGPPLFAVADTDLDGSFEVVSRVIPLGVPNGDKASAVGVDPRSPPADHATYVPDHFRVLAFLPGGAGSRVEAEVASTGPEGADLPPSSPGFPPSGLVAPLPGGAGTPLTAPLVLLRQSDDPAEPAFNRYLSAAVVVLADPRAQLTYVRSGEEKDLPGERGNGNPNACLNCDLAGDLDRSAITEGVRGTASARRLELWSGDRIRISIAQRVKDQLPYLADVDLRAAGISLSSIRGDLTPPVRPRPALSGDSVLGVAPHSGEYTESTVDLAVPGRALTFAFDRTYASQAIHDGPLGRNFDSSLFERLRPRPSRGSDGVIREAGEVDWFDGSGRRLTFVWQASSSRFDSPAGVASTLAVSMDGMFHLLGPDGSVTGFDQWGRKVSFHDRHVTKPDTSDGNRHLFLRDGAGRLVAVEDDLGRRYRLSYDPSGHVRELTDFDGRTVNYTYDGIGRLASVRGPSPDGIAPRRLGLASSAQPGTDWTYSAATAQTDVASLLKGAPQIESVTDGNGAVPLRIGWDPGRPGVVRQLATADGSTGVSVDTGLGKTIVTDPRSAATTYTYNSDGHVTAVRDPLGNTTSYTYTGSLKADGSRKADGLLASVRIPGGQTTTFQYDTERNDRRGQFNLLEQRRTGIQVPGQPSVPDLVTRLEQYDANGSPGRVTAPDGSVTTVARNDRGDPISVARTGTSPTTMSVDTFGRVTSLFQAGRTETRSYDAPTGQLQTVSVAGAGTTTYTRDARGNAVSVRDALGNRTTYEVDRLDRVTKETRGGGSGAGSSSVTTYVHDAMSQITNRSSLVGVDGGGNPINSVTEFAYDALGRMVSRSSSDAGTTSYAYDGQGNLKLVTAPGGRMTSYLYDLAGRLTGIQGQPSATCPAGSLTGFGYNSNGTRISQTNSAGATTTYLLDGHDRVTGSVSPSGAYSAAPPDAGGRVPIARTMDRDAQGNPGSVHRWSEQRYDAAGRVIQEIRKLFTSPVPATGPAPAATDVIVETRYDDAGRVADTIDPLGRISHTDYDEAGRPLRITDPAGNQSVTEYDAAGRSAKTTVRELRPDGGFDEFVTAFAYDDQGRLAGVTAPGGRSTSYEYDPAGRKTRETGPDGSTRRFFYDLAGRKVREIDAIGAETRWDYDQAGNLIRLTDANGHATTFTYDAEGRLASETRPDGKGWTRAYDCAGNEISLTTPSGIALGRTYDPEGRLTGRTVTGGMLPRALAESVSYDLLGRAVRKTATGGSSDVETRFVFDSLDRLITETTKIGAGPDRSVARSFDLAGNVTRLTYPSGRAFLFGFDPLDRMRTVSSQAGAGSVPVAAYDDVGRRQIKKTLGNGLVETRTYGVEPWLKTIDVRTPAGTAPTLGLDYGQRSPAGYKLDVIRSDRGRRNHYVYDLAGRITTEQLGLLEPPPAPPAANLPDVEDRYALDPVLNITKRERTTAGMTVTTIGVADARNRTTQWGSESPTWDADGNLTGYKGMSLSYGMDSRLTKATLPNGDSLEVLYDADGRKVRETTTSGTTKGEKDFVQAGNQIIEVYPRDGTTPSAIYVHGRGIDEVVEAELDPTATGTTTHVVPLQDELGNVSYLTDQNGQVLERYDYEGYGKFRIFDPAGVPLTTSAYGWNRHFQGREYIPMLDAYDFRARTLWPELGRFGQEDPAGTVDSTNRYQALGGRWNGVTDPTGKYELDVHFYAIYFLTRAAGFGVPAARRIAWASQYVDNSPEGKPAPESATDARGARNALAEQERIGALHFAGPFGQVVVENNVYGRGGVRLAARRKDLTRLGVALHTFADSFSHAGFIMKWDKRNERTDSYRPDVGHADAPEGGHAPDRPYLEVAKAMRMASGALKMLQEAYMLYSGRPAPAIDGAMLEQDLGRAFSYTDSDEHTRAAYWKGLISLRLGDAPHYDPGTSPITSDAWSRAISDHVRAIKDLTEGRMNPYSLLPPDELRQEW